MARIIVKAIILAGIVALAVPRPAFAYVDPNTGGLLFQFLAVLFAALSGVMLFFSRQIRVGIARVSRFLRNARKH